MKKLLFVLGLLGFADVVLAANIYNCSDNGKRCTARLEVGIVGDKVTVLDSKARKIASGRIIKKSGAYGVLALTEIIEPAQRGNPIVVNNDTSSHSLEWAATFSNGE